MTEIREIVESGLCTGCGVCVSEADGGLKMVWDKWGFLTPIATGQDVSPNAVKVCPFNTAPEDAVKDEDRLGAIFLRDAHNEDEKIGRYESNYVGYCNKYRTTSSSGGLATYISEALLRSKIADYLYVVKEVNGTYEYRLIDDPDQVISASKTRYLPVTLEKLFEDIRQIDGTVAVSGVACFIKAIRLKQYYDPEIRRRIPFLIGIICGGWKSSFYTDFLAQSAGIEGGYHDQEYRIKDPQSTAIDYSFGAYDEGDNFHQVKMSRLGDMWGTGLFKSRACDFCTDVMTELADISLGDAWIPEYEVDGMGTSIATTRSKVADKLISEGIKSGDLVMHRVSNDKIIESQRSSFKHRQDAVQFRKRVAKARKLQVPYVRERVHRSISIPYSLVQLQREETRRKSLLFWERTKDVVCFNRLMKRDLKRLVLMNRIFNKARRLYKSICG